MITNNIIDIVVVVVIDELESFGLNDGEIGYIECDPPISTQRQSLCLGNVQSCYSKGLATTG